MSAQSAQSGQNRRLLLPNFNLREAIASLQRDILPVWDEVRNESAAIVFWVEIGRFPLRYHFRIAGHVQMFVSV